MNYFAHIVIPLFNFTLFVIIVWALIKKSLRVFLSTRMHMFKKRSEEMEKKYQSAREHMDKSEKELADLDHNLVELRRIMESHAMRESGAIMQGAQERAETMYLEAHRQVTLEMTRLKRALINKAVDEATGLAKEKIGIRIEEEGQAALASRANDLISEGLTYNKRLG